MSFETDDMDMNQSILKTMKKIVEKMEKEDARTKNAKRNQKKAGRDG